MQLLCHKHGGALIAKLTLFFIFNVTGNAYRDEGLYSMESVVTANFWTYVFRAPNVFNLNNLTIIGRNVFVF